MLISLHCDRYTPLWQPWQPSTGHGNDRSILGQSKMERVGVLLNIQISDFDRASTG